MRSKEEELRVEELRRLINEKQEHILNEIRELSMLAKELNEITNPKVLKKRNGKNI